MVDKHADGIGLISAMMRLGVTRQCDDPATAATSSSGQGVGARSNKGGVDDGTEVTQDVITLGCGRPGGVDRGRRQQTRVSSKAQQPQAAAPNDKDIPRTR